MREIKFRVWDKVKKEFLKYPCYFNHLDFNEFTCFDRYFKCDEDGCVVQQFTGLKDTEGREIYEGDILFSSLVVADYQEVYFKNGQFICSNLTVGCNNLFDEIEQCVGHKVVGNIFENPELLNEKQ